MDKPEEKSEGKSVTEFLSQILTLQMHPYFIRRETVKPFMKRRTVERECDVRKGNEIMKFRLFCRPVLSLSFFLVISFFFIPVIPLSPLPIVSEVWAATYYVADAGSDSNNGTSPFTPWQTIAKVNSSTFQPGDSILFNRGDTWREQLTVSSSGSPGNPITFGAYGSEAH